ncbi:50S ribosomal protein L4 [Candidatus Neomarinimicrobiota bacterium]
MEFQVHKSSGVKSSKFEVDKTVFGIYPNEAVVHQAVKAELSNRRQGSHSSKSRGMVRGGGKKPFKQKGRGVARAGTIRSPIWRGGGKAFGPEPHEYKKAMPKKMRRLARRSVLSAKTAEGNILVVEEINIDSVSTKSFTTLLKKLKIEDKRVTVLTAVFDENLFLSSRNIPNVELIEAVKASTYDLINNDIILFDKAGLAIINENLQEKK